MRPASKSDSSTQDRVTEGTDRWFLLKVNATSCPDEIGQPSTSDWEGKDFKSSKPRQRKDRRQLPWDQTRSPEPGDHLLIWINDGPGGSERVEGGGTGLTATARVAACGWDGKNLKIRVSDVELFREPRLDINDLHVPRYSNTVFDDIHRDVRSPLRYLDGSACEEIFAAARKKALADEHQADSRAAANFDISPELEVALQEERERTWRLIEQRANQGPFRDALMRRDHGKCAVTGCSVVAVLEAAHLVPYASGEAHRDHPENGILLRADIHILFDRGLMAVDPESRELWIADALSRSSYDSLRVPGHRVKTGAAETNLKRHFEWARNAYSGSE